jgi:N-hydroxyarylamine O-acetyltransferase
MTTQRACSGPVAEPDGQWGSDELDLAAYLHRIGYTGHGPAASARTLRALHRAHLEAIPFETLDPVLGRPVRVDPASLQNKLVDRRRGGYCFEHNLLFAAALDRIGYRVDRLSARYQLNQPVLRASSHVLLRVWVDDEPWLADVGVGAAGLLEPMPLRDAAVSRQGAWEFRLEEQQQGGGRWVLHTRRGQDWTPLCLFHAEPQHRVDLEVYNHFVATHPTSPFTRTLTAQRITERARADLRGQELAVTTATGATERRHVPVSEYADVLRETFGIVLDPELEQALRDHLAQTPPAPGRRPPRGSDDGGLPAAA